MYLRLASNRQRQIKKYNYKKTLHYWLHEEAAVQNTNPGGEGEELRLEEPGLGGIGPMHAPLGKRLKSHRNLVSMDTMVIWVL